MGTAKEGGREVHGKGVGVKINKSLRKMVCRGGLLGSIWHLHELINHMLIVLAFKNIILKLFCTYHPQYCENKY